MSLTWFSLRSIRESRGTCYIAGWRSLDGETLSMFYIYVSLVHSEIVPLLTGSDDDDYYYRFRLPLIKCDALIIL